MKKNIILGIAAVAIATSVIAIACKKNQNFDPQATTAGALAADQCGCQRDANGNPVGTVTLPLVIAANRTLSCDTLYVLNGKTYVDSLATLTIPPGTRIVGVKKSAADSASALIVTRGGRISANGTALCPIVFTSAQPNPAPGDWGGIVILGRAPLNRNDTTIEGIGEPNLPAGINIQYGGGAPCTGVSNDNSGVLNFVRIEYAGAVITEGNELNGLTLGGVGSGTTLQNIQTAFGADDGFEFFGGTVNARRLISYGNDDDDLDFDFGYSGKIQFVVASKVPDFADGYSANPNGIESDNSAPAANSCLPCKKTLDSAIGSVVTNVTIIGNDACPSTLLRGAHFRTGSRTHLKNSIVIDYPVGVRYDAVCDSTTRFNLIHGGTNAADPAAIRPFIAANNDTLTGCGGGLGNAWIKMVNPYAATPDYTLQSTSPALSGANFTGLTGVTVTTYRGAFPASTVAGANWTSGWARWNF